MFDFGIESVTKFQMGIYLLGMWGTALHRLGRFYIIVDSNGTIFLTEEASC